jgi:hypothetical protein
MEWLVVLGFGAALVFGIYVAARAAGRHEGRAERGEASVEHAKKRQKIDADVARMGDTDLDDELRGDK